jgi:hypothetical protein
MRTLAAALVGGGLAGAWLVAGCFDYQDNCELALDCPRGTNGSSSSGGHDAGPTPPCIPSEIVGAVADTCGVFVSSSKGSDTNGKGTQAAPYQTLTKALAEAGSKPVYACGESFSEALSITSSATLYGALACASGWAYDAGSKTQLTAGADMIPLEISGATTSAEVYDFAITSANAMQSGGSSIGVLVAQATASFTRCDVTAGNGMAGSPGAPYMTPAQAGSSGIAGADACAAAMSFGGAAVTNTCSTTDSASGQGGDGDAAGAPAGGDGSTGSPLGAMNAGVGEGTTACTPGTVGDNGQPGSPGIGATGNGTLSATGYVGATGDDGQPGTVAQGGGGGGGAKGGSGTGQCLSASSAGGASGGSGGSGGCGGAGGKGGGPGGSSFALVSIDATLSFASVTLKAGSGGPGGDGGAGQGGGTGGGIGAGGTVPMNVALSPGCAGGPGGNGGNGGNGGGGRGGHAIGLAYTGTAAPSMTGVTFVKGTAGMGGMGDDSNGNMGDGAPGVVVNVQGF